MSSYDFNALLSPLDFELLVKDLISKELNIKISSFSEGKDKGIDLRYAKNKDKAIIVQCKRVKHLSYDVLVEEKAKIEKLKPKKYFLATSVDLSVQKVDDILSLFSEWMKDDSNIYNKTRLNDLLSKYNDVERKHYKLWLRSTNMISNLINHNLIKRSIALMNEVESRLMYYVKNEGFIKASKILAENNLLIISGIPGIGKTTLARLLAWEYLQKGYEIIEIRKISEGEKILDESSDSKQFLYFDDFLGENFLKYDVLEGRSNDLVSFFNRIKRSSNTFLIMTTREYILKQATQSYERLEQSRIDLYKYILDLNKYTKQIKSQILYNHLFYSKLDTSIIKYILEKKIYKNIINHRNYNPRIIEQMTLTGKEYSSAKDYCDNFLDNLENPFGIWEKALKKQIHVGSKYVLYLLLSIGKEITLEEFKLAFNNFYNGLANDIQQKFSPHDVLDFLKEIEDSFISLFQVMGKPVVKFQNPSIKDFLINLLKNDKVIVVSLLNSSFYFSQFIYVSSYLTKHHIEDNEVIESIKIRLKKDFKEMEENANIYSTIIHKRNITLIEKISKFEPLISIIKDKEIKKIIISYFKEINIEKQASYEDKLYINFWRKYQVDIELPKETIFSVFLSKIKWIDGLSNFFSLKLLDIDVFSKIANKNKDSLNEKIEDSLSREIENAESADELTELSENLMQLEGDLDSSGFEIDQSINLIKEKLNQVRSDNDSTITNESFDNLDDKLIEKEFDEDSLFNETMFNL